MTMYRSAAVLLAGLLFAGAGSAQPAPDYSQDGPGYYNDASRATVDPPARVARLSLVRGAVSFAPAGEDNWVQAEINRPLISGDKLWTDRGARAELQIGSSAIRVDERSSFHFLNLDDNMAQIELTEGTLNLRVRRIYDGQTYEIDTPTLAFVINRVGEYRIDVAPDGRGTIVTAFRGGGDAYGEAGARFRIEEGQSIRFNDAQLRDYVSNSVPNPDDFDRFCFERDGRWDNSRSRQYVSEDVIGYDDLDNYGSWDTSPDYGNVWYPSQVAVGWTPYSYGRWNWVGAYGWTWVDSSPWGFAPFHYGRWAYIGNRWGWCPGPVHVRPYYAPALVAFVGGGGARLSFSIGGPVGWFPLGPRDVYVPSYHVSRNYFTNVNVYNTTINNVTINNFYGSYQRGNLDYSRINYANRNVANAVTAVRGDVFTQSREVRGSVIPVNRETFANARVAGFAAIAPTRQSLAFDGGGGRAVAPPQGLMTRNVIAATRPPAPMASFAQRETLLQKDPGRALPIAQMRTAPTVVGNGEQAQRSALTARPNVNVVTRDGTPARSIAPVIQSRTGGPAQADSRALDNNGRQIDNRRSERSVDDRRAIDNSARMQNNPQVLRDRQTGNPVVESRTVTGAPNGRVQTDDRRALPSSRYVNPNATDNAQQRVLRGDNNAGVDTGRKVERVQRDNPQEYRSTPVERAPQVDAQQRQEMQMRRQQDAEVQQRQQRDIQQRQEMQIQQQQQAQQRQEMQMRRQQDAEVQQRQQRDIQQRQEMQIQQQQQAQQRQEMQMRRQQDAEVQQRQQRDIQQRQEMQIQQQQQAQQRQEMQMRAQQQSQARTEMMRAQPQQQRSEQPQQHSEQPQQRGRVQRDDNNDRGHR